ncbi:hypothetical protein CJD36_009530 [Flavipsychrobacter stenotrophus]|uniref:Uncharacterized protein n=1 Tax=Flavipsychrobacter stenotrophus TaxID=2077091 RepID=A0A2S7SYL3_9BACT|nr:hypothetical protein CJD36_009530 [Flavipsychrobacter stenotrophus]
MLRAHTIATTASKNHGSSKPEMPVIAAAINKPIDKKEQITAMVLLRSSFSADGSAMFFVLTVSAIIVCSDTDIGKAALAGVQVAGKIQAINASINDNRTV